MNVQLLKNWFEDQAKGDIRVWILAVAVCMLLIYMVIAVIFGGYGGHKFEMISKLKFLENSQNNYYASQEELDKARRAWINRAEAASSGRKLPAEAYVATPKSVFSDVKSGVVLYSHDYDAQGDETQNSDRTTQRGASERSERDPDGKENKQAGGQVAPDSDSDIRAQKAAEKNSQQADSEASVLEETDSDESEKAFTFNEPSFRNKPTTHAFDVELVLGEATECARVQESAQTADVLFRKGSAAIKGASLMSLDTLIDLQRLCPGTVLTVVENPAGLSDSADRKSLVQRRRDEIKYYMLHRRVPKTFIHIKEDS